MERYIIRSSRVALIPVLVLGLAVAGFAKDIHVPADYPSIQQAVDAANTADNIIVHDGTYYEHVDFKGKAITVKSENGPANTIVDGGTSMWAFIFDDYETPASELDGFTVTNCGEGVRCIDASPTIRNCVATANLAGGFLISSNSSPLIEDCTVTNNTAYHYGGGFLIEANSNPTIRRCTITYNTSSWGGGGISCHGWSSPVIEECTIDYNVGGGIYMETGCQPFIENSSIANNTGPGVGAYNYCYPTLSRCTIEKNDGAGHSGGGLYASYYCDLTLEQCKIRDNISQFEGGGLVFGHYCNIIVDDCVFERNISSSYGGGAASCGSSSPAVFSRCSFLDNQATGPSYTDGGGAVIISGSDCTFTDCVFEGNTSVDVAGAINIFGSEPTTLTRCWIRNNTAGDNGGGIHASLTGPITMVNCIIGGNTTTGTGGGIYGWGLLLTATNCTIADNQAVAGGGMYLDWASTDADVVNGIIWGNTPDSIVHVLGTCDVVYSDVEGGWPGAGNIDADPQFGGTWHIGGSSPCVDTGTSDSGTYPSLPDDDIDEDLRPIGQGYDMGADECSSGPPTFSLSIFPDPLVAGQTGTFTVVNGTPNAQTWLAYSLVGPGSTAIPPLNVSVGLTAPRRGAGPKSADGQGSVIWNLPVPSAAAGRSIWLQAVQYGKVTNVVATSIQ